MIKQENAFFQLDWDRHWIIHSEIKEGSAHRSALPSF